LHTIQLLAIFAASQLSRVRTMSDNLLTIPCTTIKGEQKITDCP